MEKKQSSPKNQSSSADPKAANQIQIKKKSPGKRAEKTLKTIGLGLYVFLHLFICVWAGIIFINGIKTNRGSIFQPPEGMNNPTPSSTTNPTKTAMATSFPDTPTRSQTPYFPPTSTPVMPSIPLSSFVLPHTEVPISIANVSKVRDVSRIGKGWIKEVFWTKDGRLVLLTSLGITVLDPESLMEINYIATETDIRAGVLSHNGSLLAVGLDSGRVRVWRVSDWSEVYSDESQTAPILSIAFSPDDNTIAFYSYERSISVVKVQDKESAKIHLVDGVTWKVHSIVFSDDGSKILAACSDAKILTWRISDGSLEGTLEFGKEAYNSTFSPDGKLLAYTEDEFHITTINTADGNPSIPLKGHFIETVSDIGFSPDGTLLISGGNDNRVKVWRIADGKLLQTMVSYSSIENVFFSINEDRIASWEESLSLVKIWRVSDGALIKIIDLQADLSPIIYFSPDDSVLYSGDRSGIKYWNMADGTLMGSVKLFCPTGACDLSPDGTLWATPLGILRVPDGSFVWAQRFEFTCVAFSPNGLTLAVGREKDIAILNVADGTTIKKIQGHTDWVRSVAFSPDGKLLVSGSSDRTLRLWRVSDGALLRTITGFSNDVERVEFSPDGKIIASAALFEKKVKLWRVSDGTEYGALPYDPGIHPAFAFSPNGSLMAVFSDAGAIDLWDLANIIKVGTLVGHNSAGAGIAFSSNGDLLASSSYDGTIILWGIPAD